MTDVLLSPIRLSELELLIENSVQRAIKGFDKKGEPIETERWFNLDELCDYLPDKPKKPTVYAMVHNASIPCHKSAKKLRFLKSEIDAWLRQGKKKTLAEVDRDNDEYLASKKGGCK